MSRALLLALLAGCAGTDDTADPPTDEEVAEPDWPEWAWDHWVWEDESTQESALALVDGYLDRNIPVSAIIIDSPWATGYNTFEWDPDLYPDPQGMIDALHAKGVRVIVWYTQMVNVDAGPIYQEGLDAGYYMRSSAQATEPAVVDWWKGEGSLIDYHNPEALDWWHGLQNRTVDLGIDGWKADGTDFLSGFASYSPGAGRTVPRLEYSHAYYQDSYDYLRERLGEDRIITARPVDNYGLGIGGDGAAFSTFDALVAGWVGDQDPDFAGLRAALDNFYWSADYGYLAFGSDIGGYREDDSELGRDRETFLRWAQQGAYSVVMENGGGGAHEPWRFDETGTETTDIYRTYVREHRRLLPYFREVGARARAEERSMYTFLDREKYRYLIGEDLFIEPILESGTIFTVTAPDEGSWLWLWGDHRRLQAGEQVTLEVPLGEYTAFVREGSELASVLFDE